MAITAGQPIIASDFVSTSAGAGDSGKVPKLDAAGKLGSTFFDPAKLPIAAFQQFLQTTQGATAPTSDALNMAGCNSDGSVLITFDTNNTALRRYARDAITGTYKMTHQIDPTFTVATGGDTGCIVVLGLYIYVFSNGGTNVKCSRFLLADLTDEQVMTVPTLAGNSFVCAWTNGTNFFLGSAVSTTINEWSVSGTTFSTVGTGTAADNQFMQYQSMTFYDGATIYIIQSRNGPNVDTLVLKNTGDKYFSSYSTTTIKRRSSAGSIVEGGIIGMPIDSSRMYIGTWVPINNPTAQIGAQIELIPISKP